MTAHGGKSNRGPAAASDNRAAILAAARRLFAAQGYHVPLRAIAVEAAVGQGVLYRHFPSRLDLAFTVFEEHFVELEELARADTAPGDDAPAGPDDEDATRFDRVWSRLVALMLEETAFIEMVVDARRSGLDYDGDERLRRLLAPLVDDAHDVGRLATDVTVTDLAVALRAVHGVAVTSDSSDHAAASARRLLDRLGLAARD